MSGPPPLPTGIRSMTDPAGFQTSMAPTYPFMGQPVLPSQPHGAVVPFNKQVMLDRVDAQLKIYCEADPTKQKRKADIGRLSLLMEAIHRNDWFYIVLNQLFCLKTSAPSILPASVNRLGTGSFAYLDILLAGNGHLHPPLVAWFAQFPFSIMAMYSSGDALRAVYESTVQDIVTFLARLPHEWDSFQSDCIRTLQPPLVQDIRDRLHLFSPVLQTTVFRAIARLCWGATAGSADAIEVLLTLHLMDQEQYRIGVRRGADERVIARSAFPYVYTVYMKHQTHQGPQLPPFAIPWKARVIFGHGVRHPRATGAQSPPALPPTSSETPLYDQHSRPPQNVTVGAPTHATANAQTQQQVMPGSLHREAPHVVTPPPRHARSPGDKRFVFPRENEIKALPLVPQTKRTALHQAPLRSPVLDSSESVAKPEISQLYRHVTAFAFPPTRLHPDLPMQLAVFEIPAWAYQCIPSTRPSTRPGETPTRELSERSLTYRLRCARMPVQPEIPDEKLWVLADNIWPEHVYFDINDAPLEPRRKLHHGRYLPIDLTQHIKEGRNELRVVVNRASNDTTPSHYAIAVETVSIMSHQHISSSLRTISREEALAAIQKSFSNADGGELDKDGLVISSSNVTIDLFDPIAGDAIFNTPVRGDGCLHRSCFDLDTFLRMAKRDERGWPAVDTWRCPICRGDVRPQTMVRDGFLMHVRAELAGRGLLNARAILVDAEGSWKVKEEEQTVVASPGSLAERRVSKAGREQRKPVVEVIELD